MLRFWSRVALLFFIVGGAMGLLMRLTAVLPIASMDYGFMKQGHSHVAFLGWGYLALMVLLIHNFLPTGTLRLKKYRWNLGLTSLFVAGMVFSFPLTGYKAISIGLLMLFLVISCILVFHFLKDLNKTKSTGLSKSFVKAAFLFYLLSGMGPMALGPIVVLFGKTPVYYLAVYYYLHFLYNGFFVFAIFGLLMKYYEVQRKPANRNSELKGARRFFLWSFLACIPAYALSALWLEPPLVIFVIGGTAALFQLLGFSYFLPVLKPLVKTFSGVTRVLFLASMISYLMKIILQLLSAHPSLALKVYHAKSYVVIGYIHLVVLGFISTFLLAWMMESGAMKRKSRIADFGVLGLLLGILITELLLFLKGLFQWLQVSGFPNFNEWLLVSSTLIPLSLLILWLNQIKKPSS